MRDRELVLRIKDATDLLAMVGQAVQLRRQGSAWVGRCPFHSERTPSFQVVPDRGFYHCFGCGKHGDAFTWLMEREGLTFGEAMEQLARSAGIELPRQRERSSAEVDLETRMRSVLDAAQEFYLRRFQESAKAREYLAGRGISRISPKRRDSAMPPRPGRRWSTICANRGSPPNWWSRRDWSAAMIGVAVWTSSGTASPSPSTTPGVG